MTSPPPETIEVWPALQRVLHWSLAATVIGSFVTHEGPVALHEILGYVALACAALRIAMGFAGHTHWRFDDCVRGPGGTWAYLQQVLRRAEPRHLGHNPLGAWMIVLLLANTVLVGATGWLMGTDVYFGVAWVAELHDVSGHLFVPLVVLHLAGALYASWRHRENLIAAMVHGRKARR